MYFLKILLEKKAEEADSLSSRIQELEAHLSAVFLPRYVLTSFWNFRQFNQWWTSGRDSKSE
jgi:hypothetical protein